MKREKIEKGIRERRKDIRERKGREEEDLGGIKRGERRDDEENMKGGKR